MPRPPEDEKPESVTLQAFSGMKNTVTAERLTPNELEIGRNIDIDDVGQPHRRRGYALKSAGDFHSLHKSTTYTYVVKDGALGIINPDYSFESLQSGIGPARLAYVEVAKTLYYSSAVDSGKVLEDKTVASWGEVVSEGTWLSPVYNPTVNLNPVSGQLLGKPPMATALAHYNGRIYLADGSTLWATELYLYDEVDKTRTFLQFESDVTALGEVSDGLYVGTKDATYFMSGVFGKMKQTQVLDEGVLPGSMISVTAELVRPEQSASSKAVAFMTKTGFCIGLDSGVSYNMTETRMLFPDALDVAAMYRKQDGVNQYVGVTNSGGTPVSTARVGDYVDAEIKRL